MAGALGGCVPFALPPGQASAGGATTGKAAPRRAARASDEGGGYMLRGAVHPLGLFDGDQNRSVDIGAGYTLERAMRDDGPRQAQGPYLELDVFPVRAHAGPFTARGGVRASGELLVAPDEDGGDEVGGGGTLALAIELASFAEGAFASGSGGNGVAGVAYGEVGVGAYAGVSHRRFPSDDYWMASAGLSLRVPAAAGFVCCLRR